MTIQNMPQFNYLNNSRRRTSSSLGKALEKLSSGYAVNRAADDAASLAISEKIRAISAGLKQGVDNIEDGISYNHSVDGASQEINDILHRLKKLAVQAANGTYDDEVDRNSIDMEYQHLLDEIGQMTENSDFNGVPLFERHMEAYGLKEGCVQHTDAITIDDMNDTLNIGYTLAGESKEYVVKIPHGDYSADELADMIDTELYSSEVNLIIGVNENNEFTMQCENGSLDYIGGKGASLFYNSAIGSSDGFLLGVTVFESDNARLRIENGANDVMSFRVGDDDTLYTITLDAGRYTRSELVDHINEKIAESGVPGDICAVMTNNSSGDRIIGLSSKESITGLAGNFIKMDGYTSPIYDICCYGYCDNTQAEIQGKKVLSGDIEIQRGRNEYFTLQLSYYGSDNSQVNKEIRIEILDDGEDTRVYSTPSDLVQRINDQLGDLPFKAELTVDNTLKISSVQYGDKCKADLVENKAPSGHMVYDFFDSGTLYAVTPSRTGSSFTAASFSSRKNLGSSIDIADGENELSFVINSDSGSQTISITLAAGTYSSSSLSDALNDAVKSNYPALDGKLAFTVGNTITLSAVKYAGADIKSISAVTSASAYDKLIQGKSYIYSGYTYSGSEETYSSLSGSNPSNGHSAVHSTAGSVKDVVSYKDETVSNAQREGYYINYSSASVNAKNGYEVEIENSESFVADETVIKYPATMTMENVLTQFSAAGKSLRDINLRFAITTNSGKQEFDITVPKGTTASGAIDYINRQLGSTATASADGSSLVITSSEKGKEVNISFSRTNICYSASKNSLANAAGAVIDENMNKVYVPANMTIPNVGSHFPLTVGDTNDLFVLNSGSDVYNLKLAHKTYTSATEIADELNSLISKADNGTPNVTVSANGSALYFTADPKQTGKMTVGSSSTCLIGKTKVVESTNGNPYYNAATGKIESPAEMRIESFSSHFPMTVNSSNNLLTFNYSSPGNPDRTVSIVIPDGTYNTPEEAASKINEVIANDPDLSDIITVSYTSGSNPSLVFKTVNGGNGYGLSNPSGTADLDKYVVKADVGSGGVIDSSSNKVLYPAGIANDMFYTLFEGKGLVITGANNHVALNVNGNAVEFDIAEGTYVGAAGRKSVIDQIKAGLLNSGASVVSGGTSLDIATDVGGNGKYITLMGSNTSPIFKKAVSNSTPTGVSRADYRCQIMGKNTIGSVSVKSYNDTMKFSYTAGNGTSAVVEVSVAQGTYTADTLAAAMQKSIDDKIGSGELTVFVSGGKIGIKGASASDKRGFDNFEGGLYDLVFQNANYRTTAVHTEKNGTSDGSKLSYIVGRNDLSPENEDEIDSGKNVTVYSGLNDTIVFDLHYGDDVHKIEFTIPAGNYLPQELADAIELSGRKAMAGLKDENGNSFPSDFFNVSIGLSELGVQENNTGISSADKLVMWCKLPDDGTHEEMRAIIDGVRGNSAYRIFYEATKSPQPSTFVGKTDISDGIVITEGENDVLEYSLNGVPDRIKIPAGSYTAEALAEKMNEMLEAEGSMLRVGTRKGHMMFYTSENGDFVFDKFGGNAAEDLIYGGEGRESDNNIDIHTGRRSDSYITYEKTRVDEHLMRINTTGVTTAERALKAISRLEGANRYLARYRALSGANENRSQHTLERNKIYIENLTAADSGLRDANIAKEVAELQKQQILTQVQQNMFGMVSQYHSSVLDIIT